MGDEQGSLDFVTPPRTRTGDPSTSHRAEARSRPKMGKQREAARFLVELHPGATVSRLATYPHPNLNPERYLRQAQLWRRLPELAAEGYVHAVTTSARERSWWPGPDKGEHDGERTSDGVG